VKPRTLVILLALVVGLGAFVWLYEREQPGSEEREKLAKRVLGVEREDITRLEIHVGDRETELVRTRKAEEGGADQDEWRLRKPIDFGADYWQVDGLVRSLAELEREREIDEYEPREVGLDEPRGRVVVELEGGATKELQIGAAVPGSENIIVAVSGEPGASVVPGSLWASLEKDPAGWRDPDHFTAEREDVKEMTLEGSAPAAADANAADATVADGTAGGAAPPAAAPPTLVRLVRDGDDFALAEPIPDRADDDATSALLRELTGLRASAFLDAPPPLGEIGLDPPRGRIVVTLDEGEPFVLLWGNRKEGAEESYAKVGDLVVTTAAALDEPLGRAAADWRSRSWSALPVFEVDEVTVQDARGTLMVTRDEGSWRRGEDAIQYGPVSDLLYAIDDAKAERIADPAEAAALALGPPELVVSLAAFEEPVEGKEEPAGGENGARAEGKAQPKKERLDLYAATPEGLVPVRTDSRDATLLLKRETRDQILAKLEAVRTAKPAGEESAPQAEDTESSPAEPPS
jgi:hypothetical protein